MFFINFLKIFSFFAILILKKGVLFVKKRVSALFLAVFLVLSSCKGEETGKAFSRGVVENNTYKSEFLGVSAEFSEEWSFLSDEEINSLNSITEELLPEEINDKLENAEIIYDIEVTNASSGSSVGVNFENLRLLGSLMLDEKGYLSSQIDGITEALGELNLSDIKTEIVKVDFAGRDTYAIRIVATISEMNFYEYLVAVKEGEYMANISLAGVDEEELKETMALFKPIE